jgi:hypothetical protein
MIKLRRTLLLLALAMLATPAFAQESLVGKDAPTFDAGNCINKPEATTFEQCKGDVILIKYWGIN